MSTIGKPSFCVPALACDSHVHILGDPSVHPYAEGDKRFAPEVVLPEDYRKVQKIMGTERTVLVQTSIYGNDNSCQLDAAVDLGLETTRVVIDIDADNFTDKQMQDMHDRSVRGIRVNILSTQSILYGLKEKVLPVLHKLEYLIKDTGWFIDIIFPEWLISELYNDLAKLRVNYCFAHYGMNKACNGIQSKSFQALLSLMKGGYCWVKLSGANRISVDPTYADVVELGQAIYDAAPDRVVWGSDFPHVNSSNADTIGLFNILCKIVPDESDICRIVRNNPAVLFDF